MRKNWLGKMGWCVLLLFATLVIANVRAEAAAVLRLGASGSDVVRLQETLQNLDYDVGSIDGDFGPWTQQAVRGFQTDNGLAGDGIVGSQTWDALRNARPRVSRGGNLRADVSRVTATAQRYLGVPYVWGGSSPSGFDCSGFTQYVFAQSGIALPRTADVQFAVGRPVSNDQLRPGDLVFFSTYEPGPSHNGIYLGEGKFINATSSRGVAIDRLESAYWAARYVGARRVIG